MKNAILAVSMIAVAAGLLAGMVLYTVSLMRQCELQILTGDLPTVAAEVSIEK